jgi:hypothetical protein
MGVDRLTVAEAALALGVTQDAIRKRVKRDTIQHGKDDGRIFVLLDATKNRPKTDQDAGRVEMVEELRDRVRRLEHDLDVRSEEIRRKDHIIAGLVNRVPELSAPASTDEAQGATQDAEPSSDRGEVPDERQTASSRRWWKRIFR